MTRGRHRPPSPLTLNRVAIADGALLTLALTCGIYASAVDLAPDGTRAATVAAPTVIEKTREPSGHGGPIAGPVAGPSFASDAPVWEPTKGPVIVNGQALPGPKFSPSFSNPEPSDPAKTATPETTPTPTAGLPAVETTADPTTAPEPTPTPTPTPIVVVPIPTTGDVTPTPVVVTPELPPADPTPPTKPTPPQPPAEPTETVVVTP